MTKRTKLQKDLDKICNKLADGIEILTDVQEMLWDLYWKEKHQKEKEAKKMVEL